MAVRQNKNSFFQNIDTPTIILYLVIVVMGWLSVYAAGYDLNPDSSKVLAGRSLTQLIWIGISMITATVILLLDSSFLKRVSPLLYTLMIFLLIVTLFIAPNIKGSHSWLVITDSIHIQPAEFSKVTTAMMLAWWCSRYEYNIKKRSDLAISLLIFLLPMLIIILQSETGSAIVFLTFFIVLYREGLTGAIILYGILLAVLFVVTLRFSSVTWGITDAGHLLIPLICYVSAALGVEFFSKGRRLWFPSLVIAPSVFALFGIISLFTPTDFSIASYLSLGAQLIILGYYAISKRGKNLGLIVSAIVLSLILSTSVEYFFDEVLQPHQQTRILVSLGMKDDPSGAGYNIRQSLIAIGSGQLTGKGFLNGTQTKLAYVPEQDTDFIFCTVGEEHGFIGSLIVIITFLILLLRLIKIAERQSHSYTRIYGYSVACIIFFHLMINIGMVIGLVPVIGIPLPFFSYGGSSQLSFTILLYILLRLDSQRTREE